MENVEKKPSDPEVNSRESQSSEEGHVEQGQRPKEKEVFKASRRHLELSDVIKKLHDDLRESSKTLGVEKAWEEHLKNESALEEYAKAMKELAEIWENNTKEVGSRARSRIKWTVGAVYSYFFKDLYLQAREREERISFVSDSRRIPSERLLPDLVNSGRRCLKTLDVGSCFNPFSQYLAFDLTAIDLHPADDSVHRGDFLKIELEDDFRINGRDMEALPKDYFHAVIFSFLLEYMPSSEQRIKCCKKAYELLKYEGILIIITPDSQHVGKNVKLMKNWKYTLGKLGFTRIKFEKLPHVTCLIFRKSLDADVAERWGDISFEPGMTLSLDIPQDKESEITPCLDITKDKDPEFTPIDFTDKEIEEMVSSISLNDKESKRKPSLDIIEQPDEPPKLDIPQNESSPSRISWTVSIYEQYFSQKLYCKHREIETRNIPEHYLKDKYLMQAQEQLSNNRKLLVYSFKHTVDDYIIEEGVFVDPHPKLSEDVVCGLITEARTSFSVTYRDSNFLDWNLGKEQYKKYNCVLINNFIPCWLLNPTSKHWKYFEKAYYLLQFEGILVITALDSGRLRNGTDLMRTCNSNVQNYGFAMIEFRKLRSLICLVFRKCIKFSVGGKNIYKEPEMIEYECP